MENQSTEPKQDPESSKKKPKALSIIGKILFVVLLVLVVGGLLGLYVYQQLNKKNEKINEISYEDLEKSFENLPSTEELDKIAEEIDKPVAAKGESGQSGEELSDGKVTLLVNSARSLDKIKNDQPDEGNKYLVVNIKATNDTSQEISIFTSNFTILDSEGNKYSTAKLKEEALDNPIIAWQYIPASGEVVGDIAFTVDKDAQELKLIYQGEKKLEFDLSK